jgi:hypothetical protein
MLVVASSAMAEMQFECGLNLLNGREVLRALVRCRNELQ